MKKIIKVFCITATFLASVSLISCDHGNENLPIPTENNNPNVPNSENPETIEPENEQEGTTPAPSGEESENQSSTVSFPQIGKKAPSEPKDVGDIIFVDGSATSYKDFNDPEYEKLGQLNLNIPSDVKGYIVAVIFYKGTECSDDGSERVLGVGLKSVGAKWCSQDAEGYNKKIDALVCETNLIQQLDGHYQQGDLETVTFTGKKNGKDSRLKLPDYSENNYEAFAAAENYKQKLWQLFNSRRNYDVKLETSWYLPSVAEMYQISKQWNLISTLIEWEAGGSHGFWTSSQHPDEDNKTYSATVSIVHGLTLAKDCKNNGVNETYGTEVLPIHEF